MITVKSWSGWINCVHYDYKGWFLFGILPLYVVRT